jgi:cysteine sulfinate desulfinase/cysteine desulfurase-like protein
MYGPKGVGALYVRRKSPRVQLSPIIDGGGHERGMRSGTLNVPGIVGLGKACEICMNEMPQESCRLAGLRRRLPALRLRARASCGAPVIRTAPIAAAAAIPLNVLMKLCTCASCLFSAFQCQLMGC